MKRLLVLSFIALFLSSCSTIRYVQLAELSSSNVELSSGRYLYDDGIVSVEYIFNTSSGVFEFIISNLTSSDVSIDIDKSLFIYNGYAYNYSGRDRYITSYTDVVNISSPSNISCTSSSGIATTISNKLPSVVLIPTGCSRSILGFDVNDSLYRQVYFARDPSINEKVCIDKSQIKFPITFSNIIHIVYGDNEYDVVNDFEVVHLSNIRLSHNRSFYVDPSMYYIFYSASDFTSYGSDLYRFPYNDRTPQSSDLYELTTSDKGILVK